MRDVGRRLSRLETGGRFMPGIAALSDEDVVGSMVRAVNDEPRLSAILNSMSEGQLSRISNALAALARPDGVVSLTGQEAPHA